MDELFNPESIAVIGASRYVEKVGHSVFKNLLKSSKKVYPVNPKASKILGKTAYPSILDIRAKIDLAVIAVPSKVVPKVLDECGKKEAKAAIIITSGFSEIGEVELQNKVLEIAKKYKIRILGPNCLGIIMPHENLNASFFEKIPEKGKIAFISQSGALGVAMLDRAVKAKIGLSAFVSVGNVADISCTDLLKYFEKDKNTSAICIYLESLKDGKSFVEVAAKSKKPIIALKAGRSEAGKKAAMSHTAALATEDKIYDGIFKQYGILRVDNLYELFEVAQHFVHDKAPKGARGLILTNAGGPGVLASDAFEKNGIEIPEIPEDVFEELSKILPEHWSKNNPIDIIGDARPERYKLALNVLKNKKFYDFLFLIVTPQQMTQPIEVANLLVNFHKKTKIPVFGCFMGGGLVSSSKKLLKENGILNFNEPEYGAQVIRKIIKKRE